MHRNRPSTLLALCLAGMATTPLASAGHANTAGDTPARYSDDASHAGEQRTLLQELAISFPHATQRRHLDVDIKRGDIIVSAHDGDDVRVRIWVPADAEHAQGADGDGFRAASARPLDFEIRQDGNTIELDANDYHQVTHVEVLVPRAIDLTLDSYRNGVIRVDGVRGHVRARSQNNDIILTDIAGTADVYGYNGSQSASFQEVTGELSFETYNGNVALTLPAGVEATTTIRGGHHGVRTQFEIDQRATTPRVTERKDGSLAIDFGEYAIGDINGGGSSVQIETTNGRIDIRTP
ncbi:MAG: hypothetical protein AAFX79_11465 [Planctomycetota bacterium]